jgi:hypothetical protein
VLVRTGPSEGSNSGALAWVLSSQGQSRRDTVFYATYVIPFPDDGNELFAAEAGAEHTDNEF